MPHNFKAFSRSHYNAYRYHLVFLVASKVVGHELYLKFDDTKKPIDSTCTPA
jgi:hypothetical protein